MSEHAPGATLPNRLLSKTQHDAVHFLELCVLEGEALSALTGAAGSGKTVTLNTALARAESAGDRVIRVNNFVAGPLSLHRMIAASLGIADAGELSAEALEPALRKALLAAGQAEPPVLAVDDAQSLLPETLRYLCLLAGLREGGRPLFRILLVGRPGFTARQAVPRQFTLELISPQDARDIVAHAIQAAGVAMSDEAVEETVQRAKGNWRRLAMLLQARLEDAPAGWSRVINTTPTRSARPSSRRNDAILPRRLRARRASTAVAVLLIAAAASFVVANRQRFSGVHQVASVAPRHLEAPPAPASPPASVVAPSNSPASTTGSPVAQAVVPPAAPPAPVSKPAQRAVLEPMPQPIPVPMKDTAPAPSKAVPPPAAAPANPAPANPAPANPAPANPAPASPPAPVVDTPPAAVAPKAPVPPPASFQPPPIRFRLYNISACHHGVCPRWQAFDITDDAHFVAAFDYSALNLDTQTLQRLRAGTIDVTVSGSIVRGGPTGRTIRATQLDNITPHRRRAASADGGGAPDDEASVTQSPEPRFLALPPGSQDEPTALPAPMPAGQGPIQLAPPPMP